MTLLLAKQVYGDLVGDIPVNGQTLQELYQKCLDDRNFANQVCVLSGMEQVRVWEDLVAFLQVALKKS